MQQNWELTKREAEVLYWVAQGKTNVEIGTILSTRPKTVEKHLERVYQKMGVENRTAAVVQVLNTAVGSTSDVQHPLNDSNRTWPSW
ncbi:MAG: helix-turn-helix transcriptional regulator [Candidatus Binatia bacterium]